MANERLPTHCALALIELLDAIENPEKVRGPSLIESRQVRLARTIAQEAKESTLPAFKNLSDYFL